MSLLGNVKASNVVDLQIVIDVPSSLINVKYTSHRVVLYQYVILKVSVHFCVDVCVV